MSGDFFDVRPSDETHERIPGARMVAAILLGLLIGAAGIAVYLVLRYATAP